MFALSVDDMYIYNKYDARVAKFATNGKENTENNKRINKLNLIFRK